MSVKKWVMSDEWWKLSDGNWVIIFCWPNRLLIFFFPYSIFFIETGLVTKCWSLIVLFPEHISTAQASQLCLALLEISCLHIKCIIFQENRRSLLWVMLFCIYVFWRYQLELGQKALGENIIVYLGTGCEINTLLYSLYTSWATW